MAEMTIQVPLRVVLARSVAGVAVAAAFLVAGSRRSALFVLSVNVALVIVAIAAPGIAARLDAGVSTLVRLILRPVGWVLLGLMWVVTIAPFGMMLAISRTLRRRSTSGWVRRSEAVSGRPFAAPRPRWAPALVALVMALLIAVVGVSMRGRDNDAVGGPSSAATRSGQAPRFGDLEWSSYAHADEPFARQMIEDSSVETPFVYDPYLGFRLLDSYTSTYVNVRDGRRVGAERPDAELTVWCFGGSTTFGLGQRDAHTIPAVIADAAAQDGLALNVVNFGVSGYVAWQQAAQLQRELRLGEPPDLIVMYDGVNDLALQSERALRGEDDLDRPSVVSGHRFEAALVSSGLLRSDARPTMPVDEAVEESIESMIEVWNSGHWVAKWAADASGVPIRFYWQPNLLTKKFRDVDRGAFDIAGIDPALVEEAQRWMPKIPERSDPPVVDLSGVLDDVETAVFLDFAHTNELGARVIGWAIYRDIEPTLRAILAER